MPNATVRADARTLPNDRAIAERAKFAAVYAEWLNARAATESPFEIADDDEMARRIKRREAAEMALIVTPAPLDEMLFQKWELLEYLLNDDRALGQRAYPLAIVALGSLKADLLTFDIRVAGA